MTATNRNSKANAPACADTAELIPLAVTETNAISTAPAPSIATTPAAKKVKTTLSDKGVLGFHNSPNLNNDYHRNQEIRNSGLREPKLNKGESEPLIEQNRLKSGGSGSETRYFTGW
jgi:hypothetical protein